jgi:hypothetical protein
MTRSTDVTTTNDDDQPTAVAKDGDVTAGVADSPRTVAAEQYAEPPTTIVRDVGAAPSAELAWSSETQTDEIGEHSDGWHGALLWVPLVALLCASIAVVVWFSLTLYRQGRPAPASPAPAPPAASPTVHAEAPTLAPIAPLPAAPPPPPSAAPEPPSPVAVPPNVSPQQANTICGWLRDPSWTMPQIESSTGDMLADDNPSFKGTPDVFKAIAAAMSSTCPDVANQRPF